MSDNVHRDYRNGLWAKAANDGDDTPAELSVGWYYPLREWFYAPDAVPDPDKPNAMPCVPFLNRHADTPQHPYVLTYLASWPRKPKPIQVGQTIVGALNDQESVAFVHGQKTGARLFDPFAERRVRLKSLPPNIEFTRRDQQQYLKNLPPDLNGRVFFDPSDGGWLVLKGAMDRHHSNLLLPNILTKPQGQMLAALADDDQAFHAAGAALYDETHKPEYLHNSELVAAGKGLTAGAATSTGHVSLIFNDHEDAGASISMQVLKVDCPVYAAPVYVTHDDNLFSEAVTLRYGADFGGQSDALQFEWRYKVGGDVRPSALDTTWDYVDGSAQLDDRRSTVGLGAVTLPLADDPLLALRDLAVLARYRGYEDFCGEGTSRVSGDTVASRTKLARPRLAEGWVKRVLSQLNRYEARVRDLSRARVDTKITMIGQAGPRFEGPIAFSDSPENLNKIGLIQAYETVLQRVRALTIDRDDPVARDVTREMGQGDGNGDNPLLLAASQIAALHTLLGDEALADASDPTIPFATQLGELQSHASALFAFIGQRQVPSLLDEELALLRGLSADDYTNVQSGPVYNRLPWNLVALTGGASAYVQTYGITDVVEGQGESGDPTRLGLGDRIKDAQALYPQGHGDAWGHYLTALKQFYRLLQHERFVWSTGNQAVLLGDGQLSVRFSHEQRFASAAAEKARVGAAIVERTFHKLYHDDHHARLRGYTDDEPGRHGGSWTGVGAPVRARISSGSRRMHCCRRAVMLQEPGARRTRVMLTARACLRSRSCRRSSRRSSRPWTARPLV